MMKLFALFLSLASLAVVYPQTADSVYADTTRHTIADTLASDTTGLFSTKKGIAKADTLIPIYQNPFYSASEFIDKKKIDFLDYRYTGDLFSPFGLSFQRNYGFVGYPNELILYGTNDISFFENGIYANNRSSGRFNLNLMPSEMIDSIEIIPSPRGFLYGPASSPAAVNFIGRDLLPTAPYTRIKYYEGPNGEAFIDAVLSAIMFRDFIFTLDISNRKVDLSYVNSTFSIWQGEAHLKYILSKKADISVFYGYNDYDGGLNGGVNVDSISRVTSGINAILYDAQTAPVYYPEKRLNILQHNVGVRLFTDPVKYLHTDLSLYYRFSNDEVSNPPEVQNYPRRTKDKTTGALLKQDVSFAFADLRVLAQYEKTNSKYSVPGSNIALSETYFTLSPVLSLNPIDSIIIPSVYYKFQNINNAGSRSYNGLGFDAALNPLKYLTLYGGYSNYKSGDLSGNVNTIQISAKLNIDNVNLGLDFINRSESFLYVHPSIITEEGGYYLDLGTTQVGGNLGLRVWKLLLEASSFYDLSKHKSFDNAPALSIASPKVKLTGGIYLDGYFFDDNLNLKTGFAVNYNSAQRIFIPGTEQTIANSFVTVDFTLAGEIKKAAVAYFTWENLFDRTYYIVPYYPMFRRGIRFGVAWELLN
ncbi:MAG TPA: putative porin [Ignavibacteriaceae bacterium]